MVARVMGGRSYLSIGDVLSLLREEFPDVTISKIRFLESQGLVDPERSPSGYRKFYEDDVARLRWVLRKQRDQFLPLKVIRDRLAAAGNGVPPDDEPVPDGEPEGRRSEADPASAPEPGTRAEAHAGTDAGSPVGNGSAEPEAPPASAVPPASPVPPAEVPPASPVPPAPPVPPAQGVERAREAGEPQRLRAGAHVADAALRGSTPPGPPGVAADLLGPAVSGVSLTLEELCAATGLTPELVASLEALGLVSKMLVGGGGFYDEEALTIGKLVVEFGRYGVEPRHLRMYRNAVDREVGLVEQVIMPLLRQRNPEARQRAVDAAADLARLGQSMRASLFRTQLRRQLGG